MTESIHIKEIVIEPLTRANFADFGDVIETESAKHFPINDGRVERYHDLASVQLGGENRISYRWSNDILSVVRLSFR
jgi:ureidoglycolate hydrolase